MENTTTSDNSLSEKFKVLNEPYIFKGMDGYKIVYITTNNFLNIFKKKDYYIYLNYSTLVRYFLYDFFANYKGDSIDINTVVDMLKKDKTNKRLGVIDYVISDPALFNVIKKYYPEKEKFDLDSKNYDLLNHIFYHKEKIFAENNLVKLIKNAVKNVEVPTENGIVGILNKGLIKGHRAEESTIHEKNFSIDFWLVNDKNRFSVKAITLTDKSEYNFVVFNGVVKLLLYEVKSDANNFKKGINAMRYQYIAILCKDEIMFLSTSPIDEIANRKLDKQVSIDFNKELVVDMPSVDRFVKHYKVTI